MFSGYFVSQFFSAAVFGLIQAESFRKLMPSLLDLE